MIKVSFHYPYREGGRFDIDYYCSQHMPLVASRLGDALKGWSVEAGIAGARPDSPPPYVAVGHLLFDSEDAFRTAIAPVGRELHADLANYTDGGAATLLVSEVRAPA
jgi:uncharacterized protein (TIGR02118 family)